MNEKLSMEKLKEMFPELRNLEGRFLALFLNGIVEKIATEIEDWAIWARLELGKIKCFDKYTREVICVKCMNLEGDYCKGYPNLGQTWDGKGNENATLVHPNTGEWYWCIRECPNFKPKT